MSRPAHRPKGSPNKMSALVKDMIIKALHQAGGVEYLVRQANKKNPAPFLALVGKVLPLQITGGDGQPVVFNVYTGLPPSKNEQDDAKAEEATAVPVLGVVTVPDG